MFDRNLTSLIEGAEIENAREDRKKAKRIGQFKVSNQAIYKADNTYLPITSITGYAHDKTSVHVSGCCAGGVPVERLIAYTDSVPFQFLFDSVRDIDRIITLLNDKGISGQD